MFYEDKYKIDYDLLADERKAFALAAREMLGRVQTTFDLPPGKRLGFVPIADERKPRGLLVGLRDDPKNPQKEKLVVALEQAFDVTASLPSFFGLGQRETKIATLHLVGWKSPEQKLPAIDTLYVLDPAGRCVHRYAGDADDMGRELMRGLKRMPHFQKYAL